MSPSRAPVFFLCPLLPSACYAGYSSTGTKTMPDRVYFYSRTENSDFGAFVLTEGNDLEQGGLRVGAVKRALRSHVMCDAE